MENHIKNLLLNYAAHLSINCEFIKENGSTKFKVDNFKSSIQSPATPRGKAATVPYKNRFSTFLYKQDYITNCLANILLVVNKLTKNHAKILVINGEVTKLQVYLRVPGETCGSKNHKTRRGFSRLANGMEGKKDNTLLSENLKSKSKQSSLHTSRNKLQLCKKGPMSPSILQGGWVNGACSNWSRLRKIAWNSHKLMKLTRTLSSDPSLTGGSMESWVSEAEFIFRGVQSKSPFLPGLGSSSQENREKQSSLAYKHKPDCIFLINPSPAVMRECKSLNVPLCIISSSTRFKVAASCLESNQESCFLTYFILNAILR